MSTLVPENENQAIEIVKDAKARRQPLAIEGGGTRAGLGRPMQTAAILSTQALSGIIFHEPAEMVIRARAGTPLAQVEAASRQILQVEHRRRTEEKHQAALLHKN